MRLIDTDAVKSIIRSGVSTDTEADQDYVCERIDDAPSIDIVRCEECRYCKKKRGTFKGEPIIFYRCTENNRDVESDDFCSYGEREGE